MDSWLPSTFTLISCIQSVEIFSAIIITFYWFYSPVMGLVWMYLYSTLIPGPAFYTIAIHRMDCTSESDVIFLLQEIISNQLPSFGRFKFFFRWQYPYWSRLQVNVHCTHSDRKYNSNMNLQCASVWCANEMQIKRWRMVESFRNGR